MKKIIIISCFILLSCNYTGFAQNRTVDSLTKLYQNETNDTTAIDLLIKISNEYFNTDLEEAEQHINQAIHLASKTKDTLRILRCKLIKSDILEKTGNNATALKILEKGIQLCRKTRHTPTLSGYYRRIGWLHELSGDYLKALNSFEQELKLAKQLKNKEKISTALNNIGIIYEEMGQYNEAIKHFEESLKLAKEINDIRGISAALNNMGLVYDYQGDNANALKFYNKSLNIEIQSGNKEGISNGKINIGTVHQKLGDYTKAIECFNEALSISKEIGDSYGVAICVNNIGEVHKLQGNYSIALKYFKKSLKLDIERGDKDDIAISLMNIGDVNIYLNNYKEALEYLEKALAISKKIGDKSNVANSLSSIGQLYMEQGQYKSALHKFKKVLQLHTNLGEEDKISGNYVKLGEIHYKLKNYKKAETYTLKGLTKAQNFGVKEDIKTASEILSKIYATQNQFKKAYQYHILFKQTYDSIFTQESKKRLNALESRYELASKEQEIEKQNVLIKQQQIRQNILIVAVAAVLLAIIITLVAFIRIKKAKNIIDYQRREILESNEELMQINEELRTTIETVNNQKEEIEAQRDKIESANQELTASIRYAKYIQAAILPHTDKRNKLLNQHFVFFKPKNIVSGDFYWITEAGGRTIIVVADCTGHGVPGAFMSLLGISYLNDIVNKEGITHPGQILNNLREEVINALHQKGKPGETRDGMDIAICSIDYRNLSLQFAGANNLLYIVRSKKNAPIEIPNTTSSSNHILYEIRGDKTTIAYNINMNSFNVREIELLKDDCLYMFSDGLSDQFGGESGKKFKNNNLKKILLKNCTSHMDMQRQVLEKSFISWKGSYEQIDDILVLGIRI